MESREAERNPVRGDLGEDGGGAGWHEGVLTECDSWQWSEGNICVLDKFASPVQPECCSRHREIVFSAMPASDNGDFCFTILNVHKTAVRSYHAFIRRWEYSCAGFIYSIHFNFSVYDALSVIRFCILTDRINGGYCMLVCSNFLNQMGTGEGCKHLVINHKLRLIYIIPKLNKFIGRQVLQGSQSPDLLKPSYKILFLKLCE